MARLCTICARGGSKGVPGKNIRLLNGLPLIAHTIVQAQATNLFGGIAVSSDSDEILATGKKYGADILIKRSDVMASDESAKLPAIVHAVTSTEEQKGTRYEVVVDLDVTSPLRLPEDIIACVRLQEETGCSNVITGAPAHRSPYFNLVECDRNGVARLSKPLPQGVTRRQDSPPCYDMNASIYVWNRDRLVHEPKVFYEDTRLYVMPRARSFDIDEELDFAIVELIMAQRKQAA